MIRSMRRWTPLLTVVLVLSLHATLALACPNCKDSVGNSDAQSASGVPGGFNHSVYLLLSAFLVVLGSIVTMIVKVARRS
jgi:hypothetical protein